MRTFNRWRSKLVIKCGVDFASTPLPVSHWTSIFHRGGIQQETVTLGSFKDTYPHRSTKGLISQPKLSVNLRSILTEKSPVGGAQSVGLTGRGKI